VNNISVVKRPILKSNRTFAFRLNSDKNRGELELFFQPVAKPWIAGVDDHV
jgi:hypothetical protein